MSRMDYMRQGGTPFDGFLYANIGEDHSGQNVSVLSALARLGLDPWDEAADLSDLPQEGARLRLAGLLARFRDVPALLQDSGMIVQHLITLLPKASVQQSVARIDLASRARAIGLGPLITMMLVLVYLVWSLFSGTTGTGE